MSGRETSPLKICIPHDETAQDVCIQQVLPHKLVEWLMKTHRDEHVSEKAVGIVKGLLNARIASIPTILTQEGIHDIDLENRDADVDAFTALIAIAPPRTPSRSSSSRTSECIFTLPETPLTAPLTPPTPNNPPQQRPPPPSRPLFTSSPSPAQGPPVPSPYRALLNHMIHSGRRLPFPDKTVFATSQLAQALTPNNPVQSDVSAIFSSSNFSTMQLRAAGELFVCLPPICSLPVH